MFTDGCVDVGKRCSDSLDTVKRSLTAGPMIDQEYTGNGHLRAWLLKCLASRRGAVPIIEDDIRGHNANVKQQNQEDRASGQKVEEIH
jgi:hypothetical protein